MPDHQKDTIAIIAISATFAVGLLTVFMLAPLHEPPADKPPETVPPRPARKPVLQDVAKAVHHGPLHLIDEEPVGDLVVLHRLLRHYAMGNDNQFPAGTNEEVTDALTRPDAYGIAALPTDHPAISPQGELTDRWGSPYFFHALSSTRIEIRSAGPDGRMHTADDLVWPNPESAGPPPRNASVRIL